MKYKNIRNYVLAGLACCGIVTAITSCNDEWTDEQYAHYISFKAPLDVDGNSVGVTTVYVPMTRKDENGNPIKGFAHTSYELPVLVAGSTTNGSNLRINIAADPDTLQTLNEARFSTRDALKYLDMTPYASFDDHLDIPAGKDYGLFHIDLDFSGGIDWADRWVLPLTIEPGDGYERNPRKNYAKALLRILPYTTFSGSYESGNIAFYMQNNGVDEENGGAFASPVQLYAIDDNTAFFYAGNNDETRLDRKLYKVTAHFEYNAGSSERGTVTFTAENENLNFESEPATFMILETDDPVESYIKRRTVIIQGIDYTYTDYTISQGANLRYHVKGLLTMERKLNTQMPEEDQIQW